MSNPEMELVEQTVINTALHYAQDANTSYDRWINATRTINDLKAIDSDFENTYASDALKVYVAQLREDFEILCEAVGVLIGPKSDDPSLYQRLTKPQN